ncbi:MAG: hypothetical protein ACLRPX_08545 [Ruthenibacterium sp.]
MQAWNTEVPVERTLESDVTASDSRLLAVPANGRLSTEYFRTALFIGDSLSRLCAVCTHAGCGNSMRV